MMSKAIILLMSRLTAPLLSAMVQLFDCLKVERFYIREGEEFGLGGPLKNGSERLAFAPDSVLDVPLPPMHNDISPQALKQSNDYSQYHQIVEFQDGWSTAGRDAVFTENGSFNKQNRPAMVIDRQNDPYLRAALDEAKARFGHLPPREARAVALTKWAKEKLTPAGMSEKALDSWYTGFNHDHGGQRVYFGQFLKEGKGVCSQQAILLKLAADQFPDLSATLVRGNYYVPNKQNGGGLNHAWTESSFGDNNRLSF